MVDANTLKRIETFVDNLKFDFDALKDQSLNEEAVKAYRERFLLFVGDNCPAAINAYMQKANSDDTLNDITKIYIMRDATRALEGKEF